MPEMLYERITQLNEEKHLDISLDTIAQIYGDEVVSRLAEGLEDTVANIECLVSLGFEEDVSDICNRYGILLCEDPAVFCDNVKRLIDSVGPDYVEKLGEDMSYWEKLM